MLNGAVIGTGKIAITGHMPAYQDQKIKNKVRIVAAADTSEERRRSFSDLFRHVRTYESVDELLRNEKIDFIDICVPPKDRLEIIKKAVRSKIHILCEKPFALTLTDAHDIMTVLGENNIVFMPCHQYKYSPIWINFKKTADAHDSRSKMILQFNVQRLEADVGFTPSQPGWRTDPSYSGGGILADTGIHYIYLSLWMLGAPLRVTASTYNIKHEDYKVGDTAFVVIESEKGITELNLTWAADRRANSAGLISSDESLSYDGIRLMKFRKGSKKNIKVPDAADKSTYISYYISLIDDFRKMIRNSADSSPLRKEAFESIHILKACYSSAEHNKTVELPMKDQARNEC